MKLSAILIKHIKKVGWHGDGHNLWLQVSPSGTKSWVFRYTRSGKQRVIGLGPVRDVSLALAREKAHRLRLQLLEGQDPAQIRKDAKLKAEQEKRRSLSFDEAADALIAARRSGWRSEKHAEQWTSTLRTYASPTLGCLDVAEIDTPLVMQCIRHIWTSKTETATRVRQRIETVLDWATVSGYRQGDNPARWRGHLEHLLPAPEKVAIRGNHPSLNWRRAPEFFAALRCREGYAARALEFTILTAARTGEVRGAVWSELDLEHQVWKIPANRMKAGREHLVPLSKAAIQLLTSLARVDGNDFVFPGAKVGVPMSDASVGAVIKRMKSDSAWADDEGASIVPHGFRSTFRMWAAEATDYPREVAEHALAHQLPDKVEAAYQRGTQFPKRVAMMNDWADYLMRECAKPAQTIASKLHEAEDPSLKVQLHEPV